MLFFKRSIMKSFYVALLHLGFAVFSESAPAAPEEHININQHDVTFYLYTRANPSSPVQLVQTTLNRLDINKALKFIIHGYFESAEKLWYKNMTNEYLKKGDYNVVQIDWSKPASDIYVLSAGYTQDVGTVVGRLIATLHRKYGLSLDNVHVIGHSLGAHVSGYVGKEVIRQTGSQIARITALDAAAPLFEGLVLMEGLTKYDARVVDAIHTDGGVFGRARNTGTVDFYPNGGIAPQPGCTEISITLPLKNYVAVADEVFCSHQRSYYYFINSINNEDFPSLKCDSWDDFQANRCNGNIVAIMGDNYAHKLETTGKFYLRTNPHPLYARNL